MAGDAAGLAHEEPQAPPGALADRAAVPLDGSFSTDSKSAEARPRSELKTAASNHGSAGVDVTALATNTIDLPASYGATFCSIATTPPPPGLFSTTMGTPRSTPA